MDELWRRSAGELAALIRKGNVSSRDVVEAHLARIEAVNGKVNAVTVTLAESARTAADQADSADAADRTRPLHGVPFTIKENIDCMGSPTTQGLPSLAEALPEADAPIVQRMKAAGAIAIGRTNMPELGARIDTDNPLHGRTYNPWNRALTCGGSSGGEGVALATGMTPIGLGNDIGGSVRNPAYCCGIAALKPSIGRVPWVTSMEPVDGGIGFEFLSDGPMARSVADLKLGLSIIAGRHIGDPKSVNVPLEGPIPDTPRAALVTSIPGCELPAATVREIERAGRILEDQGWQVESAQPPELEQVIDVWGKILLFDTSEGLDEMQTMVTPGLHGLMAGLARHFYSGGVSLDTLLTERRRLRRLWSTFLTDYAVAVGPTWTNLPFPCDADLEPESGTQLMVDTLRFIAPGNVLGIPGLALPTGVDEGLATGVQIYADLYRDDLCLLAAECIEREVDMPTPIDPVG